MTRAWISALKLDIGGAFYFHPLFWTAPLFAVLIILYMRRQKKWNKIAVAGISILYIIVYIIRIICGWRG